MSSKYIFGSSTFFQIGTGNPEAVQVLTDFLKLDLMPNVKVKNISSTACVIVKVTRVAI